MRRMLRFPLSCFDQGNSKRLVLVNYSSSHDLKLSNLSDEVPDYSTRTNVVEDVDRMCSVWVTRASVDGWGPRSHGGTSLGKKTYLLSISAASSSFNCVQLQALVGSRQRTKKRHSRKQNEAAQGRREINYQTKGREYIRMNGEEKTSIPVPSEYLKFEITDAYPRL